MNRWQKIGSISCGLLFAVLTSMACSSDETVTLKQVQDAVAQVATMKDQVFYQSDTGKNLANLTKSIDPKKVDDKTLGDMESLLDSNNDLIRYWGATAIGNLGARAKPAVPKLLAVFHKVDCLDGPITSANAILSALEHIGVKPPSRTCKRISA